MDRKVSYVPGHSLGCSIVHTAHVFTKFNFDPDKLTAEIEHRARNTSQYKAAVVHLGRAGSEPHTYLIKFAHLEAIDDIYAIIEEIERAVEGARAIKSLLDLVAD